MSRYRKKPVVVEAEQWFPGRPVEGVCGVVELPDGHPAFSLFDNRDECDYLYGWIETLEGGCIVVSADWIITGVKGEKYHCKPDVFEQTYEPVQEHDE